MSDLINVDVAAELCKCSTKQIWRLYHSGRFPAITPIPGKPWFKRWERLHIERYVAVGSIEKYNELYLS